MNTQLLAMWITLIGAVLTVVLLLAWAATGRRHTPLRITAGLCGIITALSFFYWRFLV